MESLAFLAPATLFMLSMTLTPGPNNVMLTASGANYGYWRTLPHIFGILIGCLVLFIAIALGLGLVFERYPIVQTLLKVLGSAYLLYLAWKIATAPPPDFASQQDARPMTFLAACLFQFANPKAWVMAISGIASFTLSGDAFLASAVVVIAVMGMTNLPSIALWAGFGVAVGKMMKTRRHWQVFNAVMGMLTAACVLMILS